MALSVKNPPINVGDVRGMGSIPRSERSPGGGHGKPLQDSYVKNPMDRGARQARIRGCKELEMTEVSWHTHRYICCSVAQLCPTLCSPMDCSTPGFPVSHHLLQFAKTQGH